MGWFGVVLLDQGVNIKGNLTLGTKSLSSIIVDLVYPVGAIYISTKSTSPASLFTGTTWTQITDRFLYCTTSGGVTGGSKKITVENLPAHTHGFNGGHTWGWGKTTSTDYVYCPTSASAGASDNNYINTNTSTMGATASTGSGTDYMPPYYTVYAWKRTILLLNFLFLAPSPKPRGTKF